MHRGAFASFLSGGFITAIVVNPPERKLAKRISVQCLTIYSRLPNRHIVPNKHICEILFSNKRPVRLLGSVLYFNYIEFL